MKKIILKIILILFLIFIIYLIYEKFKKRNTAKMNIIQQNEDIIYNSNIIKDVSYISKDSEGNEYIIEAKEGEIDLNKTNVIFLKDVEGVIKLTNSNNIYITSDFGKYNIENYDTIFSQNVVVTYLENKITSEYVDFSITRNSMIISKNVVYTNIENIIKADVAEVNLKTKDTKIYMYENNKMVNIKSKKYNGNN